VNLSIIEMDSMTQQNAALVEQAAAAAQSLQDQASELAHVVSIFKLVEGEKSTSPQQSVARRPGGGRSAGSPSKPPGRQVRRSSVLPPPASASCQAEERSPVPRRPPATSGKNSNQVFCCLLSGSGGKMIPSVYQCTAALLLMRCRRPFAAEVPAVFDAKACKAEYPKASLSTKSRAQYRWRSWCRPTAT
jgi:hypothetical protein